MDPEVPTVHSPENSLPSTAEAPYSIYSRKEKWFLVILIAGSGLFRHVDYFCSAGKMMKG
jgi:hypothetical protein